MIVSDIEVYDGNLLHNRFAYRFFRNKINWVEESKVLE